MVGINNGTSQDKRQLIAWTHDDNTSILLLRQIAAHLDCDFVNTHMRRREIKDMSDIHISYIRLHITFRGGGMTFFTTKFPQESFLNNNERVKISSIAYAMIRRRIGDDPLPNIDGNYRFRCHHWSLCFNTLMLGDAYLRRWTSVVVMFGGQACRKPLPEPMPTYQLDT